MFILDRLGLAVVAESTTLFTGIIISTVIMLLAISISPILSTASRKNLICFASLLFGKSISRILPITTLVFFFAGFYLKDTKNPDGLMFSKFYVVGFPISALLFGVYQLAP